uniref:Uncharacterized protein n=1 Tax=Aegilops tauschii TaxID=37682 RepID=R7WBS0_AEGTA
MATTAAKNSSIGRSILSQANCGDVTDQVMPRTTIDLVCGTTGLYLLVQGVCLWMHYDDAAGGHVRRSGHREVSCMPDE